LCDGHDIDPVPPQGAENPAGDPRYLPHVVAHHGDHLAEGRAFVAGTDRRFDLIQVPLLDSFGAAAAGVHSLHESYTYTVEALRAHDKFGDRVRALHVYGAKVLDVAGYDAGVQFYQPTGS
jgi:hypothetical protein